MTVLVVATPRLGITSAVAPTDNNLIISAINNGVTTVLNAITTAKNSILSALSTTEGNINAHTDAAVTQQSAHIIIDETLADNTQLRVNLLPGKADGGYNGHISLWFRSPESEDVGARAELEVTLVSVGDHAASIVFDSISPVAGHKTLSADFAGIGMNLLLINNSGGSQRIIVYGYMQYAVSSESSTVSGSG